MPDPKPPYAVLTGDLVASGRLSAEELRAVRKLLVEGIREAKDWERGWLGGDPEFFQGDAWQLLLRQPAYALRLSVFLQTVLRTQGPARTRISIGIGLVENLSGQGLGSSTGEAFTLSGRGLELLKNRRCLALQFPGRVGPLAQWAPLAADFCDALVGDVTRRQAEVLRHALHPDGLTHDQIRSRLDREVSRQTVTKSLQKLHWAVLRKTLENFESTSWADLLQAGETP